MQSNTRSESDIELPKKVIELLRFELGNRLKSAETFRNRGNVEFELEAVHPSGAKVSVQGLFMSKGDELSAVFLKSQMNGMGKVEGGPVKSGYSTEARAKAIAGLVLDTVGRIEH